MERPIVVLHGWSDNSKSFRSLGKNLAKRLDRQVTDIFLGDWVSLNDDVTFNDLNEGMQRAWEHNDLPVSPRSVDIVVHSTGALVARDWMQRRFAPGKAPFYRFVMLAPANFGSPLAHKGRSFIGRMFKGWNTGLQTGTHILKGLELASPFTWELAEKDVFLPEDDSFYGAGRVLATVLVGSSGYTGIMAAANEDGSDGTVRVATANLNADWLGIKLSVDHEPEYNWKYRINKNSPNRAAFGILAKENHGTITDPKRQSLDTVIDAISVDDAGWNAWKTKLWDTNQDFFAKSKRTRDSSKHGYQNMVVRVFDDLGNPAPEFFVEFDLYLRGQEDGGSKRTQAFYEKVIQTIHSYGSDSSYRAIHVNMTRLLNAINEQDEHMNMNVHAEPRFEVDHKRSYAGYQDFFPVVLGPERIREFMLPFRTLLIDVQIERTLKDTIFELNPMK